MGKKNKDKFCLLYFDQQVLWPQFFAAIKHSSSLALNNNLPYFSAFHLNLAHLKVILNCGNKSSYMSALSITYNTTLRISQFENNIQNQQFMIYCKVIALTFEENFDFTPQTSIKGCVVLSTKSLLKPSFQLLSRTFLIQYFQLFDHVNIGIHFPQPVSLCKYNCNSFNR